MSVHRSKSGRSTYKPTGGGQGLDTTESTGPCAGGAEFPAQRHDYSDYGSDVLDDRRPLDMTRSTGTGAEGEPQHDDFDYGRDGVQVDEGASATVNDGHLLTSTRQPHRREVGRHPSSRPAGRRGV